MTIGSRRFVVFPPVIGAAAYYISLDTELASGGFTRDTVVELYAGDPRFSRDSGEFRVIAVEANLYRYLSDTTAANAGLDGALGVFGGASSARMPLPRR